jgi:hypothetical protein
MKKKVTKELTERERKLIKKSYLKTTRGGGCCFGSYVKRKPYEDPLPETFFARITSYEPSDDCSQGMAPEGIWWFLELLTSPKDTTLDLQDDSITFYTDLNGDTPSFDELLTEIFGHCNISTVNLNSIVGKTVMIERTWYGLGYNVHIINTRLMRPKGKKLQIKTSNNK